MERQCQLLEQLEAAVDPRDQRQCMEQQCQLLEQLEVAVALAAEQLLPSGPQVQLLE